MKNIIALQSFLSPELPEVINNVDYQNKQRLLQRIDDILTRGKLDELFVKQALAQWLEPRQQPGQKPVRDQDIKKFQQTSQEAFRALILKSLMGYDYRALSVQLAQCPLYRWFCQMERIGPVKVPGKSTLQEWAQRWPVTLLQAVIDQATRQASDAQNPLELKNQIELDTVWLDSTCLKANIHFPVDWLLLRDGVRTLMKATRLIREHGLKHRMARPESFLKAINQLAMAMSAQRRQADGRKRRKKILRSMKQLCKVVRNHATRHRQLLDQNWEKTDWTRPQAEVVLARMDQVLAQLPQAIQQAHERIIGQRPVANADKILSLYEREVNVIVRGKAGSEVEFGNTLLLAENAQGLILDWQFFKASAPHDSKLLLPSVDRINERFGPRTVKAVAGDRGFDSQANERALSRQQIYNGVCPKNPQKLNAKKHAAKFIRLQHRRAQTEGRIAIVSNDFAGSPMRSKGFEGRHRELSWHILSHNLWVLARLERQEKKEPSPPAELAA